MAATAALTSPSLPCRPRNLFLPFSTSSQLKLTTLRPLCFSSSLSHGLFSKGCLSMSTIQTPIRGSIICMARRYGSNTRKRMLETKIIVKFSVDTDNSVYGSLQIKSRRRGGDLEKKKKRRRKVTHRKKDKFKIIRFVSEVGTGYVYAKRKGKNMKNKLEIKKYDPKVKHRVLFRETK